jgi:hypothetical protein
MQSPPFDSVVRPVPRTVKLSKSKRSQQISKEKIEEKIEEKNEEKGFLLKIKFEFVMNEQFREFC